MCRPAEHGRLRRSGFSLIELLVALAIVALLSTVALPSFLQQIRKARRADAVAAVLRVQQAQERYRAVQPNYAPGLGAGGLGLPGASPSGYYLLTSAAASGAEALSYTVQAQAQGAQAQDSDCRYLALRVNAGQMDYASGTGPDLTNLASANKACWGQP
jgi:type IV pilus assembly protein PilE